MTTHDANNDTHQVEVHLSLQLHPHHDRSYPNIGVGVRAIMYDREAILGKAHFQCGQWALTMLRGWRSRTPSLFMHHMQVIGRWRGTKFLMLKDTA